MSKATQKLLDEAIRRFGGLMISASQQQVGFFYTVWGGTSLATRYGSGRTLAAALRDYMRQS